MLKMVSLSKIRENPHRDKKRNPIDKAKLLPLVESIGTTGFWKGVYGREVGKWVEIAFGHSRVEAARVAGLKEIPVEVEELTDADMLMRMTRENLRGELLVALEAVNAAVKAYGLGTVKFEKVDPNTRKDALRIAPSYVPGKVTDAPGASGAYTADTLARFLGGVYVKPDATAQPSVRAALGILEMEERKVEGFSERTLKTVTDEGDRYLGAKKIIQIVSDVKQREIKVIERREKTAAETAEFDRKQRELQAKRKEEEKAAAAARAKLVADLAEAKREEDAKRAKEIKARLEAKEAADAEKETVFKIRQAALNAQVEERRVKEATAKKEDEYLPVKRETERILHKLQGETATTKEALSAEVKALARLPLNATDRERLRQAALTLGAFYTDWVAMQFLPPLSTKSKLSEYRSREEAKRRAQETKEEKTGRKAAKEKEC